MDLPFTDIIGQKLDNRGKTRMLMFKECTLFVSAIPPINDVKESNKIVNATLDDALQFIDKYGIEIKSQDGVEEEQIIQGLFCSLKKLPIIYIPLKESNALPDIPFSEPNKLDPEQVEKFSDLEKMREEKKKANIYLNYAAYLYARNPKTFYKNFTIKRNFDFQISEISKNFTNDSLLFEDDKLIVPSKEVRDRLIKHVELELYNDSTSVTELKEGDRLRNWYNSISDFRNSSNNIIFISRETAKKWKRDKEYSKSKNTIAFFLNPNTREPYFYKNVNIFNGETCIVQNVFEGNIERALMVCDKWRKDKINLGAMVESKAEILEKIKDYRVYTESELRRDGDKNYNILEYDDGRVCALLRL